ncbi:MAG: hypothetical protein ACJ8AI_27755 [Rhodopila sp.]
MNDPVPDAMNPEPGGYRVGLLPATELLLLQLDAARGDEDAQCMVTAAIALIQEVATAPHDQPARCACCPQPLRRDRYLIGCIQPAVGSPTIGLGFLVCDECGFIAAGLGAAVARMLRTAGGHK